MNGKVSKLIKKAAEKGKIPEKKLKEALQNAKDRQQFITDMRRYLSALDH